MSITLVRSETLPGQSFLPGPFYTATVHHEATPSGFKYRGTLYFDRVADGKWQMFSGTLVTGLRSHAGPSARGYVVRACIRLIEEAEKTRLAQETDHATLP